MELGVGRGNPKLREGEGMCRKEKQGTLREEQVVGGMAFNLKGSQKT